MFGITNLDIHGYDSHKLPLKNVASEATRPIKVKSLDMANPNYITLILNN